MNVDSVAEALMTLLDSYDEPVIPSDFYQRCLDAHHDPALSRQVIHCTRGIEEGQNILWVPLAHSAFGPCKTVP